MFKRRAHAARFIANKKERLSAGHATKYYGTANEEILGFEIRAFSFLRLNCQSRVESEKANVGAQKSRKARERESYRTEQSYE